MANVLPPVPVRLRILLGGVATRLGLLWITTLLFAGVANHFIDNTPPDLDEPGTATILMVKEIKSEGRTRYVVDYEFTDREGDKHNSYSTSDERLPLGPYDVEYSREKPGFSRLLGTEQQQQTSNDVGIVVVMALAGLLGILLELPDALRKWRFVRRSQPAVARVTNSNVDDKKRPPSTTLVFEYDVAGAVREGSIKRNDVPGLRTYPVLPIRFVPDQPDRVLSKFDFEPGVMTAEGELTGRDWQAWLLLFFPAATVVGVVGLVGVLLVG